MKFDLESVVSTASETMRKRIDEMGVMDSGAYTYYVERLENDTLFARNDVRLVNLFLDTFPSDAVFFEIPAGLGTVCLALAERLPGFDDHFLVEKPCSGGTTPCVSPSSTDPRTDSR